MTHGPSGACAPGSVRRALVVMPAFNEAASIAAVVAELRACGHDVVVVDDGSTDATGDAAARAGATVLPLPFNLGIGGALRCGFRYAVDHGYGAVVQVDADGQHRAEDVDRLLAVQREQGLHLVIGSRFTDASEVYDVPAARRLAMRVLARLASRAAHTTMTDASSGLRAIAQPLLGEFAHSYTVHYMDSFEALIVAARAGYGVGEVPVTMHQRVAGSSSASPLAALVFLGRGLLVAIAHLGFPIRRIDASRIDASRLDVSRLDVTTTVDATTTVDVAGGGPSPAGQSTIDTHSVDVAARP